MDKIIGKIAGFGVPGLVLLLAINATGLAGAAAITAALASLGPAGMLGGIASLGVIGMISNAVTKFGFNEIYAGVIKELYKRGESIESIRGKIKKYPISKDLKRKLLEKLDSLQDTKEDEVRKQETGEIKQSEDADNVSAE